MQVSLPFRLGITLPTALAAPVDDGIMMAAAPCPPRQSFAKGPSTVFWAAGVARTVVIKPSTMPDVSLMAFARGTRQFVVREVLETMSTSGVYLSSLTPNTNTGVSAEGRDHGLLRAAFEARCGLFFSDEDTLCVGYV